jgi:hypothetical protein
MDNFERQFHTNRIISGITIIAVEGARLEIRAPSAFERYRADIIYKETLEDAKLNGSLSEDEVGAHLKSRNLWNPKLQKQLDETEKKIEEAKVFLYQNRLNGNASAFRERLEFAKSETRRLRNIKHSLDYMMASYVAHSARARYLIAVSAFYEDGTRLASPTSYRTSLTLDPDRLVDAFYRAQLGDDEIRELAHNDPWLSIARASNTSKDPIFGAPAANFTDEQKSLLNWSSIYESIRQHPECPPGEVIEDDDLLDGWLILQRQNNEKETFKESIDGMLSDKARDCQEVFVVASEENAVKIGACNDKDVQMERRKLSQEVHKHGEIEIQYTKQAQDKMRMAINQRIFNQ